MIISYNLIAMNANRQFNITNKNKAKSTEKLSSGYRINRAADDAAGLSISEKMRRQIRGLSQGIRNTEDGVSLCQVADGALAEVSDMLHRITELSIQSANGTNSDEDRKAIQHEIGQIIQEIDRIGDTTEFNTKKLFVGDTKHIEETIPDIFNDTFFGTKNQLVNTFLNNAIDGKDNTISIDKTNYQIITAADINVSSSGERSLHLSPGIYEIDNSVKDVQIVASGNVTIIDSVIEDSHILCTDGTNLTIENVKLTYGCNTGITGGGIIFRDGKSSLTYLGQNSITAINPQTAALYLWNTHSDSELTIRGNGILTIDSGRSASVAIGANNGATIDIESGNLFINIGMYDYIPNHQAGIGNNMYFELNNLIINGGTTYINTSGDGTIGINSNNITINNGTLIATGGNQMNTPNGYNTSEGIKTSNLSINGGALLSIGGKDVYDNPANAITVNNTIGIPVNNTTDNFNYCVNTSESYLNQMKQGYNVLISKSLWIQSGSEAGQGMWLEIDPMNANILGINDLDVSTVDGANHAMDSVKGALEKISSSRSKIGAQQNRLEHTIANEQNVVENTTSAESRIRDTDMAKEMVEFSKELILENAGQAMLAQANKSNQGVLSLLQ